MAVNRAARRAIRPEPRPSVRIDAEAPSTSPLWSRLAAALVALFAIVLVAMMAGPHRIGDIYTETDFYGAYGLGARLIEHGHFDASRYSVIGPVHELTLALVGFVIRDLFVAAEVLSAAAMVIATLLWFRIARARVGAAAACGAVAFLVTNGTWLRYGYSATTDALAIVLQAGFAALLLTRAPTMRRLVGAGAIAALAFLTRYNSLALLPAGLLIVLLGGSDTPASERPRAALGFAAGFLALVVPWTAFSLTHGGHAGLQLHHNVAYEVFARAHGISWDTYERTMQSQFPTAMSVLARDPGAVLLHMVFNFFDHARLDAIVLAGWPLACTALLGAALAWQRDALRRLAPVFAITLLLFATLVPAFYSERYALALLPGWALLAGVAVASPRLALAFDVGRGQRLWLKAVLALVPLSLALLASVRLQRQQARYLPIEALAIVREAKPLFRAGDRVMARKSYFAWHAGLDAVPFPFVDDLATLAAAARRERVRWLYFSWPEAELRPAFDYLLDTTNAVPGLVPRAVTRHNPAVLYEITPAFGAEPAWAANDTLRVVARARARLLIGDKDWRSRTVVALHDQRVGRYDQAQPLLDQAVHIAPEEIAVLLPLGENLLHTSTPGVANDVFVHAEQLEPGNAQARLGRGWAALLDQRPQDAAELWRPVVSMTDDAATLQRMLQLYTALHDEESARVARARLTELGFTR